MAQNKTFGRLLKMAVNGIAAYEGKNAPIVEDELGRQIGLSAAAIQRYKAGHLPPERRTIEILAAAAVQRGHLDRSWADEFLQAAGFPASAGLLAQLFPEPPQLSVAAVVPPRPDHNRSLMIDKVERFWIKGVLEQSLHYAVLLDLDLRARPDAVERAWDAVIQQPDRPERLLPSGTALTTVFEALHGDLLILGAPGSGKTTMLLDLARDLLAQARRDPQAPIPVVLNLSTWSSSRSSLSDWLIEELNVRYQVSRRIVRRWLASEQLTLLLDGLDEVRPADREACVAALNAFRREGGSRGMVVASRVGDYELLAAKLRLQGAVQIQPLNSAQIDRYLQGAGPVLAGLREEVARDRALRELAESPLMLSIMSLACQGELDADFGVVRSLEERRRQIFELYVERMFTRRSAHAPYPATQVRRQLGWLALQMQRRGQSVFAIEGLQPAWLSGPGARLAFGVLSGALMGIVTCLLVLLGLAVMMSMVLNSQEVPLLSDVGANFLTAGALACLLGMALTAFGSGRRSIQSGVAALGIGLVALVIGSLNSVNGIFWLLSVPVSGLLGGVVGLIGGISRIVRRDQGTAAVRVVETLHWSWVKARRSLAAGVLTGQLLGGFIGTQFDVSGEPAYQTLTIIISALCGGVIIGALALLIDGLEGREQEQRTHPNQGIHQSARHTLRAILAGSLVSLVLGPVLLLMWTGISWIAVPDQFFYHQAQPNSLLTLDLLRALYVFLVILVAPLVGGLLGLISGGMACLQHLIVRLLLWRSGALPWNLPRFLDYAAERLFLRRVGGSYIFVHRLLLEHIAATDGVVWEGQVHGPSGSAGKPTTRLFQVFAHTEHERRPLLPALLSRTRATGNLVINGIGVLSTSALLAIAVGMGAALYTPDPRNVQTLLAAGPIDAVSFAERNGGVVAAMTGEHVFQQWDVVGVADSVTPMWNDAFVLDVSATGAVLATNFSGGLEVRQGHDGALLYQTPGYHGRFSPDGTHLVVQRSLDRYEIVRIADRSIRGGIETAQSFHQPVVFSSDGSHLLTVDSENIVRLWDLRSYREVSWAALPTQAMSPFAPGLPFVPVEMNTTALALSPNTDLAAAGLSDGTIAVSRLSDGRITARLRGHNGFINDLAFSPDGMVLASASSDRTIRLWRVNDGVELALLRGHQAGVSSLRFSPDGRLVLSGSNDRSVRLWRVDDLE